MIAVDATVDFVAAIDAIALHLTNKQAPAVQRRKGDIIECCEAKNSGRRS